MSKDINRNIVDWIGRLGAAGASDVAAHLGLELAEARARLGACTRAGQLRAARLLHGEPALYVATRAGLRSVGLESLAPCRVSTTGFAHLSACGRLAVALERAHPDARLASERELRLAERRAGRPIASAEVGLGRDGEPALHRPDLVLFGPHGPVAIEVELTIKSPRRLRQIVRGWGRCRLVQGVVYHATPGAARAVRRAVDALCASDRVTVVELEPVGGREPDGVEPSEAIAVVA
jgi:hypothetical protein